MKILYAVQGTGNGHLSRAMDVIPCLKKRAEVDILVSGIQADLDLPFEVKYRKHGLSFIFGKAGGVDLWRTFMSNKVRDIVKEVNETPVEDYDLVINDFEPVTAWACHLREHPCIGMSHQSAVLDSKSPKPEEVDMMGKFILKHYAPVDVSYGFHFQPYSPSIFTPVIRKQIREQEISDKGHYTVYLPAYDDARLLKSLLRFDQVQWDVFSKHNRVPFSLKNVNVQPINNQKFVESMASCHGILCGAGFETPAEALFLGKKLMVVPMKNQYEQHLNAAALMQMGIPVIKNLKSKNDEAIERWINTDQGVKVSYPDNTQEIVDKILATHLHI
ncbi:MULTISPECIES: glycosyltransferase family protein [Olivibacter]|uniref:Glycosyltransferase family protein n=1 Tax=Olivibacter jilunii TaxID=985016 RepID=A0ABW6AXC6_9SPHI|nr:glycosyl transferase [Olivibacter sp. UJ_SKK_5.1]MDX3914290.1 glycosyltransferase family protein [Pseudosphingobacterium sp.]